jgi:methyl-accepting chemotaxis protein
VATEVRRLAVRSGQAAAEIQSMSASSVEVAGRAAEQLELLVPDIERTAELVQEISAASQEQSMGVDQIGTAVGQLDTVVHANAAAAEEMTATSAHLADRARALRQSIAFFHLTERADAEMASAEAPPDDRPVSAQPCGAERPGSNQPGAGVDGFGFRTRAR